MPRAVEDPLAAVEVRCVTTVRRALKMALSLRLVEALLPQEDRSYTLRRRQVLHIASWIEAAAKEAMPELPKHDRPRRKRSAA